MGLTIFGYFFKTLFYVGNEDKIVFTMILVGVGMRGAVVAHQLSDGKLTMATLEILSEISLLEGCREYFLRGLVKNTKFLLRVMVS